MILRLLMALSDRLPCKIIKDGASPYLERYYIGTLFGVRTYLHRFVACDPDRGLHDHPWRWAMSIVLAGYYFEMTRYYVVTRPVRWFNFLTGESFHRVILPVKPIDKTQFYNSQVNSYRQHCWTLFIHHAERSKGWGFLRDIGTDQFYEKHQPGADDEWWKTAKPGRLTEGRQA
jgi:hypothetical protein